MLACWRLIGFWNISVMEKLADIYYSPRGYWKGHAAVKKLAATAKVSEDLAGGWLKKASHLADLPTGSEAYHAADV